MTESSRTSPLILIAAGGTGGHLFPAKALAEALAARNVALGFVTDRRGEAFEVTGTDLPVYRISASSPSGGIVRKVKGALSLLRGTVEAWRLLGRLKPAIVVGFGGYPSVPAVLAAGWRGIPVVLHEQNAMLGRANRLLAGRARCIGVAYDKMSGVTDALRDRLVRVGNPVRAAILVLRGEPYLPASPDGPFRILVTGGSQGATIFSDVVPDAVGRLSSDLRGRIELTMQARAEGLEAARASLAESGVKAELQPFFSDLPQRLASAHLVICRAGASTIAELTVAGRPAILVPYPHAADDHQRFNATALATAGGGYVVPQPEFSPPALAERLTQLMIEPERLVPVAAAAHGAGEPDAARRLADLVLGELGRGAAVEAAGPGAGNDPEQGRTIRRAVA